MDNGVRAMKIVLLADLHGNMVATKAMEQELERIRPDEVYFLGDAIGKGRKATRPVTGSGPTAITGLSETGTGN